MRHFLPSPVNNTGSSPSVDVDRCFNCWKPTHTTRCCPLPAISVREREALRIRLNIPYPLRNGRKYYEMLYSSLGCTNCWSSIEHRWDTCPKPRISIVDSEKLRYKMGMPLHGEWKRILEENGVSSTIVGDVVLVVREDDDDDSDNPGPVVQKISPAVAVARDLPEVVSHQHMLRIVGTAGLPVTLASLVQNLRLLSLRRKIYVAA